MAITKDDDEREHILATARLRNYVTAALMKKPKHAFDTDKDKAHDGKGAR